MSTNVEDILQEIAVNVNGVAETPTSDELTAWMKRLNVAYQEWANTYEPQLLIKQYNTTFAQSGTSLALPADFKEKFAGYIKIDGDNYQEFDPIEGTFASGDYVTWGGNLRDGYYMNISVALSSQVSVMVPYHSRPTSLSTLTSIPLIPDPEFLTARTTEKVMLQRGQAEYVEFQTKADLLLQRLVATEVSSDIQKNKTIRTQAELDSFVIGDS